MSDYILSCCSTADLSAELMEARDIHYICFHYEVDGTTYPDDLGQSIPFSRFYQMMCDGAMTRTSQVAAGEYEEYFESFLREGKDILHLTLSSGISGTLNSAMIAAEDLREKYPERKIYIVDSLAASSGYGLFMDRLADLRDSGMSIDEVRDWAEDNKLKCLHWFFTSDLTFFIRGGRVSKASGMIGQVLNICPLLNVDAQGKLIPREKHRGKKKVIHAIVQKMREQAENGLDYSGKCFISQSDCLSDARAVADAVEAAFPKLDGKVRIFDIGTTIGSHTGPGTVALFFWGQERRD
ncbi:MAG: DegV family protein [Lachnospiraceae bacterium]|nr:DegV family protein [Lachnospiraceae bacterium]